MEPSELLLGLCIGIGLAAACGFRVFIPMLVTSIAANSGHLTLAEGFQWIGSDAAMWTFVAASVLEVGAYYIPWLDNALDSVASPAAVVAGTILTASMVGDISPLMKWSLALIAGGGVAGVVQGATVLVRGASTATTGGLANPIVATVEHAGSVVLGSMAVIAPVAAIILIPSALGLVGWKLYTRKPGKPPVITTA